VTTRSRLPVALLSTRQAASTAVFIATILFVAVIGHVIYAALLPVYAFRHRHGGFFWAEAFGYSFPGRDDTTPRRDSRHGGGSA